jgi:hypothetical protein
LPGGFAGLLVTPNPQEPDPCPDDFTITGILQLARKTRREATAAIEAAVARYLQQLEPQLNCAQFTCTEGACEFDAMVEYDPPRKVFQPTQKHGRKRRWIASATLLIGCFCRGSTDEDENDPPEEDENGHGKG